MMRPFVGFKITGSNLARAGDLYDPSAQGANTRVWNIGCRFSRRLETLFDYLPKATVTIDDQVTAARLSRWDTIVDQYETRKIAMDQKSRIDTVYKPISPELLYMEDAAFTAALDGHRVIEFHPLAQASGPGVVDAGGRIGRNFSPERSIENVSLFGALADHVKNKSETAPVVIAIF